MERPGRIARDGRLEDCQAFWADASRRRLSDSPSNETAALSGSYCVEIASGTGSEACARSIAGIQRMRAASSRP